MTSTSTIPISEISYAVDKDYEASSSIPNTLEKKFKLLDFVMYP